jgi:hypothetical protein
MEPPDELKVLGWSWEVKRLLERGLMPAEE